VIRRARELARVAVLAAVVVGLPDVVVAGNSTPAPTDAELPALAAALARRSEALEVTLPDGSNVALIGNERTGQALLSPEQLETCLRTVSAAESWPAAWLVVQHKRHDFDLVVRIALDDALAIATPDFVFTVARRDWEISDIKPVVREATGRKPPREGIGHLVVQGFSTKVVQSYVYDPVPTGEDAKGLARLLPEGSLIREARAVDLGDGQRYTLALVLQTAVFEPSECNGCPAKLFGHADSGAVTLMLTNDTEIIDRIELGPKISGLHGRALLPRYRCEAGDEGRQPSLAAFEGREEINLIDLRDLDGDGFALELSLPAAAIDCDQHVALVVRIVPDSPALEVVGLQDAPNAW
jgi:hypothetical protein